MTDGPVGPVVALSTKLPVGTRDKLAALARRRNVTPSALLRQLVEVYLAGSVDDGETGDVERAVRAEFAEADVELGPQHAVAVNLARRMDRDPTNGAAHARELRWLLAELRPVKDEGPTGLDELRATVLLQMLHYTVTSPAPDGGLVATRGGHPRWVAERQHYLQSHGIEVDHPTRPGDTDL
jgi:hypothetical protein